MRISTLLRPGLVLLLLATASAQIPVFPAADLVLGQPNFTSDAAPTPPGAETLRTPFGVAVDPTSGHVWVADSGNNRVLRYASAGALASGASAEIVLGQATFADDGSNQGNPDPAANTLNSPAAVFLDPQGRLWVADAGNDRVLRFNGAASLASNADASAVLGQPDFVTAGSDVTDNKMNNPIRIWLDQNDRLWVADSGNNRVLRFDNAPFLSGGSEANGVLGQVDFTSATTGLTRATLNQPGAVTVDAAGRLYVSDVVNNRILRFDGAAGLANGAEATAVLGQANFTTGDDGFGPAEFDTPIGLFVDSANTLWVADAANSRVLRFDNAAGKSNGAPADGVVGQPNFATTSSGLSAQKLSVLTNVWVDGSGALWVADSQTNNRVVRFSPAVAPPPRPTVTLTGRKLIRTRAARVILRGRATAATSVRVKVGATAFRPARLTGTNWTFPARPRPGRSVVLLRATGPGGQSPVVRAAIIRR